MKLSKTRESVRAGDRWGELKRSHARLTKRMMREFRRTNSPGLAGLEG